MVLNMNIFEIGCCYTDIMTVKDLVLENRQFCLDML